METQARTWLIGYVIVCIPFIIYNCSMLLSCNLHVLQRHYELLVKVGQALLVLKASMIFATVKPVYEH